jgi:hypothetical protein
MPDEGQDLIDLAPHPTLEFVDPLWVVSDVNA